MATDREKLEARMAAAGDEDLRLIVTGARSALERSEAARELARRGLEVPASALGGEPPALDPPGSAPRRPRPIVIEEDRAPMDSVARLRMVAVGAKLGVIASVFSVFVLPSSIGTWPIVLTGATLGGITAYLLTRR